MAQPEFAIPALAIGGSVIVVRPAVNIFVGALQSGWAALAKKADNAYADWVRRKYGMKKRSDKTRSFHDGITKKDMSNEDLDTEAGRAHGKDWDRTQGRSRK